MTRFMRQSFGLILLAVLAATGISAAELPWAKPAEVGFSAERLDYIDRYFEDLIGRKETAGVVTLIARHGKIVHFGALGYADAERQVKMRQDTIFRLYSMTKPIAATALMMLYQDGRFQLQEPIAKYLPEMANLRVLRNPDGPLDETVAAERQPTIQDVLRHTAGFSEGTFDDAFDAQYRKANLYGLDVSLAQMMTALSKLPLRYQPGARWAYSVSPEVQARLVDT